MKCDHEGCESEGQPYQIEDEGESRYCAEHAHDAGFCYGCGGFFAGIEVFDFEPSGLCENCKADNDEFEREDEFDQDIEIEEDWP